LQNIREAIQVCIDEDGGVYVEADVCCGEILHVREIQ
jgi:hypothetical protein